MDTHTRAVAALHILYGSGGAVFFALGLLAINGAANFVAPSLPHAMVRFGSVMFLVMLALAMTQAVAGAALLRGSKAGRAFVLAFAFLGLANKPWGILLGIYTFWALLRKQPASSAEAN